MKRSTNCLSKLDRMRKTLRHQEADRVPVSDFFWGSFLRRWRDELGLRGGHRHLPLLRPRLGGREPERGSAHQAVRDPARERTGSAGANRVRGSHPQAARSAHACIPRIRNQHGRKDGGVPSSTTPGMNAGTSAPGTIRSTASATASSATPRRSSPASRKPTPISPSLAESWRPTKC